MRKIIQTIILLVLLGFLMPAFASAGPLDTWTWRNPLPQGNNLNAIAYGNSKFVAVGDNGTILTSADDGETWTKRDSGTTYNLYSVTYNGSNLFMAVGESGKVVTSTDGETWTVVMFNDPDVRLCGTIYGVAYGIVGGNAIFVAVGANDCYGNGYFTSSTNGQTWVFHGADTGGNLYGIAYGNTAGGKFYAVGEVGSRNQFDGTTWTRSTSGNSELHAVVYGNNTFAVPGGASRAVAFRNAAQPVFVAVGLSGDFLKSNDGSSWSAIGGGPSIDLKGVAYGNGKFVAVGNAGTILVSSNDWVTWATKSSGSSKSFYSATYGNGLFVAVGESGTIVTSANGTVWTPETSNTPNALYGVTYGTPGGSGLFAAVGSSGTIVTSADGDIWTPRVSDTFDDLKSVTYSNGVFVAVGGWLTVRCKTMKSTDGLIWTDTGCSGTTSVLNSVTYGNNSFVANGGPVYRSTDNGSTWSSIAASAPTHGITYGFGKFIAVGYNFKISYSSDGSLWTTALSSFSGTDFESVAYANGSFISVGESGMIYTSSNGISWTARTSGTNNYLNGVTFGNNTFVAVGNYGTILQSGTVVPPQVSVDLSPVEIGSVNVGSSSSPTQITIANAGGSDLLISSISISGNDAAMFSVSEGGTNACASLTPTIAAEGNCTLLITFTPSSSGAKSAVLNIVSNATDSPTAVNLSGTGVQYTLTVAGAAGTSTGSIAGSNSISCSVATNGVASGTCSEIRNSGAVTLTATPAAGTTVNWNNSCTASIGNTCNVTLNQNKTITASFTLNTYTVTPSAGQNGSIDPATPQSADHGTTKTFTVTPNNGYTASVGGTCGGSLSNTTYTTNAITSDCTVTASFTLISHTVTPSAGQNGSINPATPQSVNHGSTTSFTVTPANGYTASVGGTCGGSLTSTTYTTNAITGDCTVTATFTQVTPCTQTILPTSKSFSISGGNDSITVTSSTAGCAWSVSKDASWITISSGSSGTGDGTVNYAVAANTSSSARNGSITIGDKTFAVTQAGVSCTYTISPTGKSFASSGGSDTISITASASDCSWTAAGNANWITISSGSSGTGNGTVSYTASENAAADIRNGNIAIADKTYTITQGGVTVAPPQQFALTVSKTGDGSGAVTGSLAGIDCGPDCSEAYNSGTSLILTAAADSGSTFTGWSGCESVSGATCTATINSNVTISASFTPISENQYTLSVIKTGNGGGTVTSDAGEIECGDGCEETGAVYNAAAEVTLTATVEAGSAFGGWTGDACDGSKSLTCTVTIDSDKTITASFKANPVITVIKSGNGAGTVTSSPKGISCGVDCSDHEFTFKKGRTILLKAKPAVGSRFMGWSGDVCNGSKSQTCKITKIDDDVDVTATFGRPDISVPDETIDYGEVIKKQTSSQTLTIQNNGDAPLKVKSLRITGKGAGMFKVTKSENGKPISSATIAVGEGLELTIKFKPTATGVMTVVLQIISDDADNPRIEVPLTGNGTVVSSS